MKYFCDNVGFEICILKRDDTMKMIKFHLCKTYHFGKTFTEVK